MRILIVSPVYPPEPVVSSQTSSQIAQALADRGHIVTVVTAFPNRPMGKIYEGYERKFWTYDRSISGLKVLRVFSLFSSRSKLFSRLLENFSFGIASALAILILGKPDIIYANTWPIVAQGLLMLVCKWRRIPLVLSIQDLYPESLLVQKRGIRQASPLYKLLRWLDVQIARNCAGIIVISDFFKEIYIHDRHVAESKIAVIPNWIDDIKTNVATTDDIRKKHGIPADAFLVVYGGNVGVAAGVEYLIDAFQYLAKQENIYLLIAGAGSNLDVCLKRIREYELECVKIHSPWHVSDTFSVLNAADLCIVPTLGDQSLVSVPSKLLGYMMAGRPVLAIASLESETARIVMESQAGWVISSSDSETISKYISEISRMSFADRESRGYSARSFVMEHFSINQNLPKVVKFLLQHEKQSE